VTLASRRMHRMMSIQEKIRAARDLLERWGTAWREDRRVRDLLASLEVQSEASRRAMQEAGVPFLCRQCDEQEGGSCCGEGIEDRYDPLLLALNLLLGVALPEERRCEKGCFFLEKKGCCLQVREVLCVNYLCRKIQEALPLEALIRVQRITGDEMETVFRLAEALKKSMCRWCEDSEGSL